MAYASVYRQALRSRHKQRCHPLAETSPATAERRMNVERLTARTHDGHAYLVNVKSDEQEVDCASRNTAQCIMDSWERLAAYEDTGLSPADIATLTARAEAAEAERDAAVEDMTAVLKRDSDDICAYCKNRIECKNEQCEKYSSGVGDVDGNYPDWKWTCMDFDYGTCSLLADTPCNGCFDDDCKGFEWRGPQAGKGAAPNE